MTDDTLIFIFDATVLVALMAAAWIPPLFFWPRGKKK